MNAVEGRPWEARDVACIREMIEWLDGNKGYELRGDPTWDDADGVQFVLVQNPHNEPDRPDFQELANNLSKVYQGKVSIAVFELTEVAESAN